MRELVFGPGGSVGRGMFVGGKVAISSQFANDTHSVKKIMQKCIVKISVFLLSVFLNFLEEKRR